MTTSTDEDHNGGSVIVKQNVRNPTLSGIDTRDHFTPLRIEQMFNQSPQQQVGAGDGDAFDVSFMIMDSQQEQEAEADQSLGNGNGVTNVSEPPQKPKVHEVYRRHSSYDTATRSRLSQLVSELDEIDSDGDGEDADSQVANETPIKKLKLNDSYLSVVAEQQEDAVLDHYSLFKSEMEDAGGQFGNSSLDGQHVDTLAPEDLSAIHTSTVAIKDPTSYELTPRPPPRPFKFNVQGLPLPSLNTHNVDAISTPKIQQRLVRAQSVGSSSIVTPTPKPTVPTVSESFFRQSQQTAQQEGQVSFRDAIVSDNKDAMPAPTAIKVIDVDHSLCQDEQQLMRTEMPTDVMELPQINDFDKTVSTQQLLAYQVPKNMVQYPVAANHYTEQSFADEQIKSEVRQVSMTNLTLQRPVPPVRRSKARTTVEQSPAVSLNMDGITDAIKQLEKVNMHNSAASSLPQRSITRPCQKFIMLPQFANVSELDLSMPDAGPRGQLSNLDFVADLKLLEYLRIRNQSFTNTDLLMQKATQLVQLDASHNLLKTVSVELGSRLVSLNLDSNPLQNLTVESERLQHLSITNCPLSDQVEISTPQLQTLCIAGTPDLRLSFIDKLLRLKRLQLRRCSLKQIPQELLKLGDLQVLDVSGNQLKEIRPVKSLQSLVMLDVSGNQLTALGRTLHHAAKLQQLQSINLHGNPFSQYATLHNGLARRQDWFADNSSPFTQVQESHAVGKPGDAEFVKHILYRQVIFSKLSSSIKSLDGCDVDEQLRAKTSKMYQHVKQFFASKSM